jgi:hypothetical protein
MAGSWFGNSRGNESRFHHEENVQFTQSSSELNCDCKSLMYKKTAFELLSFENFDPIIVTV